MSELIVRDRPCPHCAPVGELRRRHARTPMGRFIRSMTPFRLYRCNRCGMEKWMYAGPKASRILGFIAFAAAMAILAYVVTRFAVR